MAQCPPPYTSANNALQSAVTHVEYETERSIVFKMEKKLFFTQRTYLICILNAMKRAYLVWKWSNY